MTRLTARLLPIALLAAPLLAHAQQWRDVGGERRYERAPRAVYWDGQCRVEQRVNRDGELFERRRCRGDDAAYSRASSTYADEPEPVRYRREPEPVRYAEPEAPRQVSSYREEAPLPLPVPIIRDDAPPLAKAPARVAKPAVLAPVAVIAPHPVAQPAPRLPVKPAPAVVKAVVKPVIKAPAPVVVKAPLPKPVPKVIGKVVPPRPVIKARPVARVIAKAPPAPVRVAARPKLVHIVKKSPPAAPHQLARALPPPVKVKPAPRLIAKVPVPPKPVPVAPKVVVVPKVLVAKAPVAAPTPAPAKEEKTARVFVNSGWLVTLPRTDAPLITAKATAPAKTEERPSQQRDLDKYVSWKSRDPYSNLK